MKKNPVLMFAVVVLLVAAGAGAQSRDKGADKKSSGAKVVDAGSFGIFLNGKRIGTETFRIEQRPDVSVATAEINVDNGTTRAIQSSEMLLTRAGELRSYQWRSTVPSKQELVVEAQDQLLVEHVTSADQQKTDVQHILPISTVILDDYFFSHRELLVWRYLATACVAKDGQITCTKSVFGVLVPRQHLAVSVTVEVVGRDRTLVKGKERELHKLQIDSGGELWLVWTDDEDNQFKVVKMAIPSSGVEIVRD